MPCAPPLRCRALPADVVHRVESTLSGHRVRWRPPSGIHSARCRPLSGRWCAHPVRIVGAVVRTRCGAVVRTVGAAAGMVRAPPAPGAYRGARHARSGARRRRQEEPDRAEFLYHTAPCPLSGQSPECAIWGPRVCGRSHGMGSRAVRRARAASPAGRCAPSRAGGALGARTEDVVRPPGATGARTMPCIVIAGARDAVDAGMFHSPPASAHQSGAHFHSMRTTVDSTLRAVHRRAARRTPGGVRRVRSPLTASAQARGPPRVRPATGVQP